MKRMTWVLGALLFTLVVAEATVHINRVNAEKQPGVLPSFNTADYPRNNVSAQALQPAVSVQ